MVDTHDNMSEAVATRFEAVHHRIAAQAAADGECPALLHGDRVLTRGALEAQANRLAHRLRKSGVGAEAPVGVSLERGCDMIVALLAVLKAGGAFVPLDPGYPPERLRHMREDAGIGHVLTSSAIAERHFNRPGLCRLCLDQPDWQQEPATPPAVAVHPRQLTYLIYTSGSTGTPKAVAVEHGPLAAHCAAIGTRYGLSARDRVLHFASINFDLAHEYWLMPLMHGASLVITGQQLWSPAEACARLQAHGVTVAAFPPAYLLQMAHWLDSQNATLSLRVCAFGGEAMARERFALVRRRIRAAKLINGYGPTETVISPLLWTVGAADDDAGWQDGAWLPIGHAVGSRSSHILDAGLHPVPPGMAGELHIGGYELARGYHGQPARTAERFVPDPFGAPGQRLYRTGDGARWRGDGSIGYLGRLDQQVQLRGMRVELGEIEAQLLAHPGVREAAVLAWPGAHGMRLAGYVVAPEGTPDSLRAHLRQRLPEAMVPAQLVLLEQLPRNAAGKLDRAALPAPAPQPQARRPPVTALEQALAAIWQEVLKLPRVGLDDDFFALGGHSLLAMQVVSRIEQRLKLAVPIRMLFEAPLLGAFAERTGAEAAASAELPLSRIQHCGVVPLAPLQAGLWFLSRLEPDGTAHNLPFALRLRGDLDIKALQRSFDDLAARHEVLRTVFKAGPDGMAKQVIHAPAPVHMEQADLSRLRTLRQREAAAIGLAEAEELLPFDLEAGPPWRVRLVRLEERDHVLLICVHHILADGWSTDILLHELARLYAAYCRGENPGLPLPCVHYADCAAWLSRWLASGEQNRQLAYWRQQIGARPAVVELPPDLPRPRKPSNRGARIPFSLAPALTEKLRQLAPSHATTLPTVLQAVFFALLYRHTGGAELRIGMPVANRRREECESVVGMFINSVAVCAQTGRDTCFSQLLAQLRETMLAAQAHSDLPFDRLVDDLCPQRDAGRNPLFQIMFNFLRPRQTGASSWPALKVEHLPARRQTVMLDLELDLVEHPDGALTGALSYATDLYRASTAERLVEHYLQLAAAFADDPTLRLDSPALTAGLAAGPACQAGAPAPTEAFPAQGDATEHALADAWREVLGVAAADAHQNFFALGGSSLICLRLAAAARWRGLPLGLRDCFERQTIADQAALLRERNAARGEQHDI